MADFCDGGDCGDSTSGGEGKRPNISSDDFTSLQNELSNLTGRIDNLTNTMDYYAKSMPESTSGSDLLQSPASTDQLKSFEKLPEIAANLSQSFSNLEGTVVSVVNAFNELIEWSKSVSSQTQTSKEPYAGYATPPTSQGQSSSSQTSKQTGREQTYSESKLTTQPYQSFSQELVDEMKQVTGASESQILQSGGGYREALQGYAESRESNLNDYLEKASESDPNLRTETSGVEKFNQNPVEFSRNMDRNYSAYKASENISNFIKNKTNLDERERESSIKDLTRASSFSSNPEKRAENLEKSMNKVSKSKRTMLIDTLEDFKRATAAPRVGLDEKLQLLEESPSLLKDIKSPKNKSQKFEVASQIKEKVKHRLQEGMNKPEQAPGEKAVQPPPVTPELPLDFEPEQTASSEPLQEEGVFIEPEELQRQLQQRSEQSNTSPSGRRSRRGGSYGGKGSWGNNTGSYVPKTDPVASFDEEFVENFKRAAGISGFNNEDVFKQGGGYLELMKNFYKSNFENPDEYLAYASGEKTGYKRLNEEQIEERSRQFAADMQTAENPYQQAKEGINMADRNVQKGKVQEAFQERHGVHREYVEDIASTVANTNNYRRDTSNLISRFEGVPSSHVQMLFNKLNDREQNNKEPLTEEEKLTAATEAASPLSHIKNVPLEENSDNYKKVNDALEEFIDNLDNTQKATSNLTESFQNINSEYHNQKQLLDQAGLNATAISGVGAQALGQFGSSMFQYTTQMTKQPFASLAEQQQRRFEHTTSLAANAGSAAGGVGGAAAGLGVGKLLTKGLQSAPFLPAKLAGYGLEGALAFGGMMLGNELGGSGAELAATTMLAEGQKKDVLKNISINNPKQKLISGTPTNPQEVYQNYEAALPYVNQDTMQRMVQTAYTASGSEDIANSAGQFAKMFNMPGADRSQVMNTLTQSGIITKMTGANTQDILNVAKKENVPASTANQLAGQMVTAPAVQSGRKSLSGLTQTAARLQKQNPMAARNFTEYQNMGQIEKTVMGGLSEGLLGMKLENVVNAKPGSGAHNKIQQNLEDRGMSPALLKSISPQMYEYYMGTKRGGTEEGQNESLQSMVSDILEIMRKEMKNRTNQNMYSNSSTVFSYMVKKSFADVGSSLF
jgi:hypothetical protein